MKTVKNAIQNTLQEALLNRSKITAKTYAAGLKIFEKCLREAGLKPESSLERLKIEHFITFPNWLAKQGYARPTIDVYWAAARYLLDSLRIGQLIVTSPLDDLRIAKALEMAHGGRQDRLPKVPASGQAEKLIQAARPGDESPVAWRDYALLLFLYSTGCRNAEAAWLRGRDIDLRERSALIHGKGAKDRRVYFSQEAGAALAEYWQLRNDWADGSPAFARHDPASPERLQPLSTGWIRCIVSQAARRADVSGFTPHGFRHNFATLMLRQTHDLALVQDLLGHASPATTRVYARLYPDDLKRAHRKVFEKKKTAALSGHN